MQRASPLRGMLVTDPVRDGWHDKVLLGGADLCVLMTRNELPPTSG